MTQAAEGHFPITIAVDIALGDLADSMERDVRQGMERYGIGNRMVVFAPAQTMQTPFGRLTGMEIARIMTGEPHHRDWAKSVIHDAICDAARLVRYARR